MKRLILSLALAATALSGCAQLQPQPHQPSADSGATGAQQTRPYPQSSSNLGLF
jgi:PBP1b-binding outer membrane lipoprotein LpoB